MPPTETPGPADGPQYPPATDVTYEARMLWPYLTGFHSGGNVPKNGRELGCWVAGHYTGRSIHGEPGMRVQVPEDQVAGVTTVLLEYGLIVQRHSRGDEGVTLDVWSY